MSPLPLHPVYEQLPTVEGFHWSLVIGLGPLAESLIDYLPERLTLSQDAGLYRSGQPGPQPPVSRLEERLAKTANALGDFRKISYLTSRFDKNVPLG